MALIDRRIGLLFLAFVTLLGVAVARAGDLGLLRASSLQRAAELQQVSTVSLPAPRGAITDRNGVELAVSEAADDVVADPYLIKQSQTQTDAQRLAPLLGQPLVNVLEELTRPHTGFVYLAHLLPTSQANAIEKLNIPGINLVPEIKRYYPLGSEASQVVGYVGAEGQGLSGLEYLYNKTLTGHDGLRKVVSAADGQPISIDAVRATTPGQTLRLTIDAPLQAYVEQVLAGVAATYSPKHVTAIVANPNTGAILALANWPRVNSNNPFPASQSFAASQSAWLDQAVGLNYEPGSTFKAITVAGALQDGLVIPSTEFNVPPELDPYGTPITDAESHGYEMLSVAKILQVSSNIGADLIGQRLGATRFNYWVHRFGFGAPTGVDLPGEGGGIVLAPSQYSGTTMFNLPFGQGESVTPMQMVAAYDAIANGGILRAPHVVGAIGGRTVLLPTGHRIISPTVAAELRDMLRGVLADGGTASGAAIDGYDMAGKTGTAEVAVDGKYSTSEFVGSFIGMVPTIDPQLVIAVVVDQPQGEYYGAEVAAPAFQKIVGWAVPYFGINPCPRGSQCHVGTGAPGAPTTTG